VPSQTRTLSKSPDNIFYKQGALSPALTFTWLEANLVFEVVNCFAEYLDRPELTAHDDFIVPEEST
tara:strand:- start:380 stop:577 length:198 start_codon:yes stop_codon:yes gene_type:complete